MEFSSLDTVDKCKSRRRTLERKIERLIAKVAETVFDPSRLSEYERTLKDIESGWTNLDAIQDIIIDMIGSDEFGTAEDLREAETHLEPLYDKYVETASRLQDMIKMAIEETKTPAPAASQSASTEIIEKLLSQNAELIASIRLQQNSTASTATNASNATGAIQALQLPPLEPIKFSGKQEDWASFRSTWEAIVHHSNMRNEQKMKLLKDAVQGGAAESRLRHFGISANSYEDAWQRLCETYGKLKNAVAAYITAFLNQPPCKRDDIAGSLQRLHDSSDGLIRSISSLGEGADDRDFWLIYLLSQKLDEQTQTAWSLQTADNDRPTFKALLAFLESRAIALRPHAATEYRKAEPTANYELRKRPPPPFKSHAVTADVCLYCAGGHRIYTCDSFKSLTVEARRISARTKGMCFNCLSNGHRYKDCRSKGRCAVCKEGHHTLLHTYKTAEQDATNTRNINSGSKTFAALPSATEATQTAITHITTNSAAKQGTLNEHTLSSRALLPTAIADVEDVLGRRLRVRMLLDSASTVSFITERCAQALGIERKHAKVPVCGLSNTMAGTTRGKIKCRLLSLHSDEPTCVELLVLTQITGKLPAEVLDKKQFEAFRLLELADPNFDTPGPVDILLGADAFMHVLRDGRMSAGDGMPIAQNSRFGWLISGGVKSIEFQDDHYGIVTYTSDIDLDRLLQRFFELEECTGSKPLTPQEELVERHFKDTHVRDDVGKYIVRLPFNDEKHRLGRNLNAATRALFRLERKFRDDPDLKIQSVAFMQDFIDQGHMEEIPSNEIERACCTYLPYLAIRKDSSTTTKLRIVFHASCRTEGGISLNDSLYAGPVLQRSLRDILRSFRLHRIALVADVKQMYRMVRVCDEDAEYQRIVWRKDEAEPITHYRIAVVTYGTAPASYIATKVLNEAAENFKRTYPKASAVVQRDFYMDDLLSGSDSVTQAMELYPQINQILSSVGFHLRKWASNCSELVSSISPEDRALNPKQISAEESIGTLGIDWNPTSDEFAFRIRLSEDHQATRRIIASEAARIFDPLGLLSPLTIAMKIIIQQSWVSKLEWDDQLAPELAQKWRDIRDTLRLLKNLRVPRWVKTSNVTSIQIHGFADASTQAYCAAVYVRAFEDEIVHTTLLEARTRVAPLKPITLARLELCAAVMLAKLMQKVIESLHNYNFEIFAWTDSANVLYWLSSHPSKWTTFVANRTATIIDIIPAEQWRHIDGKQNPADCATRGMQTADLLKARLWWNGPDWLEADPRQWPVTRVTTARDEKLNAYVSDFTAENTTTVSYSLIMRYSCLNRLLRITALCRRFTRSVRSRIMNRDRGDLSCSKHKPGEQVQSIQFLPICYEEIKASLQVYIRQSQSESFHSDLKRIQSGQKTKNNSTLKHLDPVIDKDGIIRISGRLQEANINDERKHPIILHHKSRFTWMLVQHEHERLLHAGPTLMMASLRRNYWIIGARKLIRYVYQKCVICRRIEGRTLQQKMGKLPAVRVNPSPAFYNTGVDYAGPFTLRNIYGRATRTSKQVPRKAYAVLFICMSSRAVHLELASDLSTEAFMAAFKRFASRRGKPSTMYSDRGTNFVGAKNRLEELDTFLRSKNFNDELLLFTTENAITWNLNPPLSPNFGGIWEANIKCLKKHLEAVVRNRELNYEEFNTFLTLVEACLNSRPLCGNVLESDDIDPLTPGHLLIGRPLVALPEVYDPNAPHSHFDRWNRIQKTADDFWRRWRDEYLVILQKRPKWENDERNISSGDIVAIRDEDTSPTKWPLARVVEVHPGKDGLVRVVTLTNGRRLFQRNVRKLVRIVEDRDRSWPAECSSRKEN